MPCGKPVEAQHEAQCDCKTLLGSAGCTVTPSEVDCHSVASGGGEKTQPVDAHDQQPLPVFARLPIKIHTIHTNFV